MYVYPTPKEPNTPKGLYWCVAAFVFYIAYQLILLSLHAWTATIIWGPITTTSDIKSLLSTLTLTLSLLPMIVGVVIVIFFFIGLDRLYRGKKEFGEKHERNIDITLFLLVGIIIAEIVGSVVLFSMTIRSLIYPPSYIPTVDLFNRMLIVQAITGTIVALLVALLILISIRFLVRDNQKMILNVAAILGTITPAIVVFLAATQTSRIVDWIQANSNASILNAQSGLPVVIGSTFSIVTITLFLLVYRDVMKRIKAGELRPYIPPPTPVVWFPAPVPTIPMVQAQVVYGPPPPQPPPTQPPPTQPQQEKRP